MYALLLGGLCIGFAPVLVRLADIGPVASAFWRLALAAPVLWLWPVVGAARPRSPFQFRRRGAAAPPESWLSVPALLLAGLFFAADLGTWHFSIGLTTIANATLLPNCAPLFVTLYAVLVERRSPPRLYFLALALALGGAVALVPGPAVPGRGNLARRRAGTAGGGVLHRLHAGRETRQPPSRRRCG